MKKAHTIVLFALLLAGCTPSRDQNTPPQSPETATVFRITDGDTIIVELQNGETEKVRIIGIDTPEFDVDDQEFDCYGMEATVFVTEMIGDKNVILHPNPYGDNRDKYKRLLRFVHIGSTDVGRELLRGGYAKNFPWFPHPRLKDYKEQEQVARSEGVGLWTECK